jgi:hypothetical protein
MFGLGNPYAMLGLVLALVATHGTAYVRGRADGGAREAAHWQADALKAAEAASRERAAIQRALDERTAALAKQQREAADAVAQIRVEYLPGKTLVRREVAERVVYRDCRVGERMRDTINSALAGRPVSGIETVPGGDAGLPGRAGSVGG